MVGRPWRRPHPAATASSQASPKSPCWVFWSCSRTESIMAQDVAECGGSATLRVRHQRRAGCPHYLGRHGTDACRSGSPNAVVERHRAVVTVRRVAQSPPPPCSPRRDPARCDRLLSGQRARPSPRLPRFHSGDETAGGRRGRTPALQSRVAAGRLRASRDVRCSRRHGGERPRHRGVASVCFDLWGRPHEAVCS